MFFSEEKNQKTFNSCAPRKFRDAAFEDRAGIAKPAGKLKVFCFFFSKKKFLLPLACPKGTTRA